jgi:hypothetical protein
MMVCKASRLGSAVTMSPLVRGYRDEAAKLTRGETDGKSSRMKLYARRGFFQASS